MHLISDIVCTNNKKLNNLENFHLALEKIISKYKVQNLGMVTHEFEGGGFTLTLCLAESHIAVHTWPEIGYVTLDVYLCNFKKNNAKKAESIHLEICEYFDHIQINTTKLTRIV